MYSIMAVLKKIWLLFGKNSTAFNWPHFENPRKAEKHVKRTTVKFDFFYNYSESSVSQSFCNYISKILWIYPNLSKKMAGCCSVFQRWVSLFLYMVGLIISGYSYYVHIAKKADENYVALCDIDETISCSKVFTSKYGKGSNLKHYHALSFLLRSPQK